jgi:glycosyltransferase involved in cell wall biosynthesis
VRVLVSALSVNNLSGRHVLLGHLSRLAKWTIGQHDYLVLYHRHNSDLCRDLGPNVDWLQCPGYTTHWAGRAAWEVSSLSQLAKKHRADFLFLPSGTIVQNLDFPQVSFAQNPWALVEGLERTGAEHFKAALQRRNYAAAVQKAAMMVYNSEYMRGLYRSNTGCEEQASAVVHQAIDDDTHEAAARLRNTVKRRPLQVLSVSAMAPHKGTETLVKAIALVRKQHGIPAKLMLVGAWPDNRYRKVIEELINRLELMEHVDIRGHVDRDELHRLYAESQVFSLMSRCESFGIPAVEAQAFGTPVVSSKCCAIPEVCGNGGIFQDPDDVEGVAGALYTIMTNDEAWARYSDAAVRNSQLFRWDICSRGMLRIFDHLK